MISNYIMSKSILKWLRFFLGSKLDLCTFVWLDLYMTGNLYKWINYKEQPCRYFHGKINSDKIGIWSIICGLKMELRSLKCFFLVVIFWVPSTFTNRYMKINQKHLIVYVVFWKIVWNEKFIKEKLIASLDDYNNCIGYDFRLSLCFINNYYLIFFG